MIVAWESNNEVAIECNEHQLLYVMNFYPQKVDTLYHGHVSIGPFMKVNIATFTNQMQTCAFACQFKCFIILSVKLFHGIYDVRY